MVHILYSCHKHQLSSEQFKNCLVQLPDHLQDAVCQFRNWHDSQASLFGKLLLKHGLNKYYDNPDNLLEGLQYTQFKKPVIPDSSLDFNISHSGEYVLCVISQKVKVGIDVEEIRPLDIEHYESHFSAQELSDIQNAEDKLHRFFSYWTKKEAVMKAEGTGLYTPADQIKLKIETDEAIVSSHKWYLNEIKLSRKCCSWLATDKPVAKHSMTIEYVSFV